MKKPREHIEVYPEGAGWRYRHVAEDGLTLVEPEIFHSDREACGAAFMQFPKLPLYMEESR